MKNFLFSIIALAALPLAVSAQTPQAWEKSAAEVQAMQGKADAERGKGLFTACVGCHKNDATGRSSGAYPRLAGQHFTVLVKQMRDIKAGLRTNPKMAPYIEDHISDLGQMADVAAWLTTLPIPEDRIGRGPGSELNTGKTLFDRDCAKCHGAKGEGDAKNFYPMVAAQHYRYLLRELHFIRDGDRGNSNPDMVIVIKPYREAELDALADYMSSLPPPVK
jgi:cytochrome c553